MKTKELHRLQHATGMARTCNRALLADFISNYRKCNAYPGDGEVKVFWLNTDTRLKVRTFFDTYLNDLICSNSSNTSGGSYRFDVSDATLFKQYLDTAKSINLAQVPMYTTKPEGETYHANEYWDIRIPYSKQKQQEELDGQRTALEIAEKAEKTAVATANATQADLLTAQAQQEINSITNEQNTKKYIMIAATVLLAIVLLKRRKK